MGDEGVLQGRGNNWVACAEDEAADDDQQDGTYFCGSEKDLNTAAEFDAEIVQSGDEQDDESGERLG